MKLGCAEVDTSVTGGRTRRGGRLISRQTIDEPRGCKVCCPPTQRFSKCWFYRG